MIYGFQPLYTTEDTENKIKKLCVLCVLCGLYICIEKNMYLCSIILIRQMSAFKILISLFILLGLFCLVLVWDIYEDTFFSCQDMEEIAQHTISVRSIQPNDTNYIDLLFLEDILKGKKIIILGEPTHFDGSVFSAKIRLIKFLHEKLGYNILVWEAGLYDIWYMNQYAIADKDLDFSLGMFSLWSEVEEMKELWQYLNQQRLSANPIELWGIDIQLSGTISDSLRIFALKNYLSSKYIDLLTYPVFSTILQEMTLNFSYPEFRLDSSQYDSLKEEMNHIVKTIQNQTDLNIIDSIYIQYLSGLKLWTQTLWKYPMGSAMRFEIRDSMMMENFMKFLPLDNSDKKIILWCSNLHLLYNHDAYLKKNDNIELNFISLGERLKNRYKDMSYSIAFTWFCKQSKENYSFDRASSQSIEFALHQKGFRYAFIDIHHADTNTYLQKIFKSRANHGYNILGYWHKMTDAFFFIDTIKSATFIKK
jgi:erythromycin esterase-like protein